MELQVPDGFPGALIGALRQHKDEVLAFLGRAESCDLPFPIGYGGLPTAQVETANAVMDKFGIADPVLRKYNVLSWIRGFYQDRGRTAGRYMRLSRPSSYGWGASWTHKGTHNWWRLI